MKKLLFTLVVIFIINGLHAEVFFAKQDVNIRSGPGSKYELIGSLNSGQEVDVIGFDGKWAKVTMSDETVGFISIKFLEKQSSNENVSSQENTKSNTSFFEYLIYAIILVIGWFIYRFIEKYIGTYYECSKCKAHKRFFNEPKLFRGSCPEGGLHRWYVD